MKIDFALHQICWTDVVGFEAQSSSRQAASGQHRTRQRSTWKDVAPAGGRLDPEPEGSVQLRSERHCRRAQTGGIVTARQKSGSQPEAAACGEAEVQPKGGAGRAQSEPRAALPSLGASSKRAALEAAGEVRHPKRPRTRDNRAGSFTPRQTSCPQTGAPLPGQATTQSPAKPGAYAGTHSLAQAEPAASLPGHEWPEGVDQSQAEQEGSAGHGSPAQAKAAAGLPGRAQPGLHGKPPGASEPGTPTGAQHTATEHFHTPPDTCAPSAGCSAASGSRHQLDIFLTAHSQDSCALPGAASGAVGCEEATSSLQMPAHAAGLGKAAKQLGGEVGAGCSASGGAGAGGQGAHQQPESVSDSGDALPERTLVCFSRALVLQLLHVAVQAASVLQDATWEAATRNCCCLCHTMAW